MTTPERTPEDWAEDAVACDCMRTPHYRKCSILVVADAIRQAVEAEREACAKVADSRGEHLVACADEWRGDGDEDRMAKELQRASASYAIAYAIRARGKEGA